MKVVRFLFECHCPLDMIVEDSHLIDPDRLGNHAWYYAERLVSWGDSYLDYEVFDDLPVDGRPEFTSNTKDFAY